MHFASVCLCMCVRVFVCVCLFTTQPRIGQYYKNLSVKCDTFVSIDYENVIQKNINLKLTNSSAHKGPQKLHLDPSY